MKNISAFFAITILSLNVFATPIPANRLAAYQEAVNLALAQNPLTCTVTPSNQGLTQGSIGATISACQSGDLDDTGAQPVLTFSYGDGTSFKDVIMVTTSADLKSVVSIMLEQSESTTQDVNLGTLENPNIVSQTTWALSASALCQ